MNTDTLVPCPYCYADAGEPCHRMIGAEQQLAYVHIERTREAL